MSHVQCGRRRSIRPPLQHHAPLTALRISDLQSELDQRTHDGYGRERLAEIERLFKSHDGLHGIQD